MRCFMRFSVDYARLMRAFRVLVEAFLGGTPPWSVPFRVKTRRYVRTFRDFTYSWKFRRRRLMSDLKFDTFFFATHEHKLLHIYRKIVDIRPATKFRTRNFKHQLLGRGCIIPLKYFMRQVMHKPQLLCLCYTKMSKRIGVSKNANLMRTFLIYAKIYARIKSKGLTYESMPDSVRAGQGKRSHSVRRATTSQVQRINES